MLPSLIAALALAFALSHTHVATAAHPVTVHVSSLDTNGSGPPI
jgi:hypothetical protein